MLSMSEYEKYKNLDDLPIVTKVYLPDVTAVRKGVIQIAHGMCEMKERYNRAISVFTELGYVVVISDLRGHGENVEFIKDLGYIGDDGDNLMVEDLLAVTIYIKNNFPDLPVILMGHSMGALLIRAYAKKYDEDIDMLVALGCPSPNPFRHVGVALTELMALFLDEHNTSKLLDKMIMGNFNKAFAKEGIPNAWLCTDKKIVEEYNKNSKCGFPFTINGYGVLCKLMCQAFSKRGWAMKNPEMRVVLLGGADDPCIVSREKFVKSVDIMKKVGYKNTVSKVYKGMRHELLNEPEFKDVIQDILRKAPTP